MDKKVVLETKKLLCALGTLQSAIDSILIGKSAITPGPSFDYPIAHASFKNIELRNFTNAISTLGSSITYDKCDSPIVLIYCAAKGDLSSLDSTTHILGNPESALLDTQARNCAKILKLSNSSIQIVSCACASGAVAVETAKELLERQLFATAMLVGFDVQSHFVTSGFHSLGALSPDGARPFDKRRNGLTLGDGAAIATFTFRQPSKGDIIIEGAGSSNDANHRTGPSRTGDGLLRAAHAALDNADVRFDQIGAIKCHGTATAYNDAMEAKAIYQLVGDKCPPCFSIKGAIGHTSGAGSLIEIIIASEFLKRKIAPPTAGFSESGVEEPIRISADQQDIEKNRILCLSAGFGGINAAVVIKEHQ